MAQELIQLNTSKLATKVMLILGLLLATFGSYCALRWYLGNTLAEYFDVAEGSLDIAKSAQAFAPNDPLAHWTLAEGLRKQLPADQLGQALIEYEKAVSLSPNDYRFWTSYGSVLEQVGDFEKSEHVLRQAVKLAPSYAYPHWYLGNLLLRRSRYDEAFTELRLACDAEPAFRSQLFSLAWQIYGEDTTALKNAGGSQPGVTAEFSLYLLAQPNNEIGLRLWNSLSSEEKKASISIGQEMVYNLARTNRFRGAMNGWNDLAPTERYRAKDGMVIDGGFEENLDYSQEIVFGWQVKPAPQMQIAIDPAVAHSGSRSLRLLFQVRSKLERIDAYQVVPVAPSTPYDFECYVRTEKLQSGSTPMIQIVNAGDGMVLATSEPAPNGDSDWNHISLSFKTGEKAEAVIVKIERASCGDSPMCPIFGAAWYDDFSIKRRD